jgi:hypothetical protein
MAEATELTVKTSAALALYNKLVRDSHRGIALPGSAKTISGGAITLTPTGTGGEGHCTVDTESSAASDDLDTISGGSDGDVASLRQANVARVVMLTTAGNIALPADGYVRLSEKSDIDLRYDGGAGKWYLLGYYDRPVTVILKVISDGDTLVTGDGQLNWTIPAALNGWNLIDADAGVYTVSSSGTPTVQINNLTTGHDLLTTPITIDVSEYSSYTAATQPVVNSSYKQVTAGDRLSFDVDAAGTGTKGLEVHLRFQRMQQ